MLGGLLLLRGDVGLVGTCSIGDTNGLIRCLLLCGNKGGRWMGRACRGKSCRSLVPPIYIVPTDLRVGGCGFVGFVGATGVMRRWGGGRGTTYAELTCRSVYCSVPGLFFMFRTAASRFIFISSDYNRYLRFTYFLFFSVFAFFIILFFNLRLFFLVRKSRSAKITVGPHF